MGVRFDVAALAEVDAPPVERLLAHPRLRLVACWDAVTPVVRVIVWADGSPAVVGQVGHDDVALPEPDWERTVETPSAAWHPVEPLLVVGFPDGTLLIWSPDGVQRLESASNPVPRRPVDLAVSPDGSVVWRSPAVHDESDDEVDRIDVVDLRTRTSTCIEGWFDTGVTAHPGGRVLLSLQSDQGATLVTFAVPEGDPPTLTLRDRAMVLDADFYGPPMVSPDGGFVAVGGNAYEDLVEVVTFPELDAVVSIPLGDVQPDVEGGAPAWLGPTGVRRTCFAPHGSTLLVGTPGGTVVALGLPDAAAEEHDVVPGRRISALALGADGMLLVALAEGGVVLVPVTSDGGGPDGERAGATVEKLLADTDPLPAGADLWRQAQLRDGSRSWDEASLATVEEATPTDPSWLQIQAFMNRETGAPEPEDAPPPGSGGLRGWLERHRPRGWGSG